MYKMPSLYGKGCDKYVHVIKYRISVSDKKLILG